MVLAEKCPNCGAFLPVRRAGVHVRRCEFCDLEVPGAVVEAPKLTGAEERAALLNTLAARARAKAAAEGDAGQAPVPPSTWVPGHKVSGAKLAAETAPRPTKSPVGCIVVIGMLAPFVVGGGIALSRIDGCVERPLGWQVDTGNRNDFSKRAAAAAAAAGGWSNLESGPMLTFATDELRRALPDAQLVNLRLHRVLSTGRMNLALGEPQSNDYEVRSPTRSRPPAGTPRGVDVRVICKARMHLGPKSVYPPSVSEDSLSSCRDPLVLPPRCSPAQLWARARAAGAPADAVADLTYEARGHHMSGDVEPDRDVPQRGEWRFYISAPDAKDRVHFEFTDDCGVTWPSFAELAARPDDAALPRDAAVEELLGSRGSSLVSCLYRHGVRRSDAILPLSAVIAVGADGSLARVHLALDADALALLKLDEDKAAELRGCVHRGIADLRLDRAGTPHVAVVRLVLDTREMKVRAEAPLGRHLRGLTPVEVE